MSTLVENLSRALSIPIVAAAVALYGSLCVFLGLIVFFPLALPLILKIAISFGMATTFFLYAVVAGEFSEEVRRRGVPALLSLVLIFLLPVPFGLILYLFLRRSNKAGLSTRYEM